MPRRMLSCAVLALLAAACTAPRSVLQSPETLRRGKWEAGANLDFNSPTQTLSALDFRF
jgi:hypothetical protein